MASLERCKLKCQRFIRSSIPVIAPIASELRTLPKFRAIEHKPGRVKYEEETQPNWWALPKNLWQTLVKSSEGVNLVDSIVKAPQFSASIGKTIFLATGKGVVYSSPDEIARELLVSYLFEAGTGRWKPSVFERIWKDCASFFNPKEKKMEYFIYAPICWRLGTIIKRRLKLGDGFEIRRLSNNEVAHLASLNPALAGIHFEHRFTLWTSTFFVHRWEWEKRVEDDYSGYWNVFPALSDDWVSKLNEEVALLRSLLNPELSVPLYAVIKDSSPRDIGGGVTSRELPWKPTLTSFSRASSKVYSRGEINSYVRRRAKFLGLIGKKGWGEVAASMRRFAIARQNPFAADVLADVIAALEQLVVRGERGELTYKLSVRTANMLAKSVAKSPAVIVKDIKDAYDYRSQVAHGDYVFDNPQEWDAARRMRRAKGKKGNPFHDINKINRLTGTVSQYYRRALEIIIDTGELKIDWTSMGL
jgi:hypothetical protein